ncbi:DUF268 domain-containing protein [Stieleria sp. TO1_6]|uniref:DUF268 domain-containing protein n=1 Tax=Stieleria tagensis TaxID=2956795 RepID=UPI00209B58F7|nr:DUF268 domain-containing protein [Stieleria tagensis]MCO8120559.1 DUF268 domain-containing protein [Stieleria tagensis]
MRIHRLVPGWQVPNRMLNLLRFSRDYQQFQRSSQSTSRQSAQWADRYPCLEDRTANTGFDRHYIYHTAWASRVLAKLRPEKHIDISSSLYFVSNVSAFVPMEFYDYRPANLKLDNLVGRQADLQDLPFEDNSVESLSCMHVVEHVGLGRYGDPIDAEGDLKAMQELQRVIAPGGSLLFVTPVGRPRVCFNAHRVYSYDQILESFSDLELNEFALIPDDTEKGGLMVDPDPAIVSQQSYGCGCFWLRRAR